MSVLGWFWVGVGVGREGLVPTCAGRVIRPCCSLQRSLLPVAVAAGQVYLNGRMVMPVPDDVTCHRDFTEVFGTETPLCAIVAKNRNRRWLRIYQSG